MAPALVPMSPVMFDIPVFPIAPVTVKNTKWPAAPRFGTVCAEVIVTLRNRTAIGRAVEKALNIFLIIKL